MTLGSSGSLWIVVGGVFLLAGLVKGAIGMGLPTVAMGLLAVTMPSAEAAAMLLIPSFVTNVWQLFAGASLGTLSRRFWAMMIGIVVGTVSGAGLLTGSHSLITRGALGVALVLYAAFGLSSVRISIRRGSEIWLSPAIGILTGLVTGATGVFVIPAVPYLQALDLDRESLIQALGLSFTVSTIALAGGLLQHGAIAASSPLLLVSLLSLVPALLGMLAGQHLRARMAADTFRRAFFIGLVLLGLYLAIEGFGGRDLT